MKQDNEYYVAVRIPEVGFAVMDFAKPYKDTHLIMHSVTFAINGDVEKAILVNDFEPETKQEQRILDKAQRLWDNNYAKRFTSQTTSSAMADYIADMDERLKYILS